MATIIRRTDGLASYFSMKPEKVATGFGSWTPNKARALAFASEEDAKDFVRVALRHDEPFCDFVERE